MLAILDKNIESLETPSNLALLLILPSSIFLTQAVAAAAAEQLTNEWHVAGNLNIEPKRVNEDTGVSSSAAVHGQKHQKQNQRNVMQTVIFIVSSGAIKILLLIILLHSGYYGRVGDLRQRCKGEARAAA